MHHIPKTISDHVAKKFTMMLRWVADTFFLKQYGHRAVVLETVAAVPGMVAAETTRGHDEAWFRELAERMIAILRNGK